MKYVLATATIIVLLALVAWLTYVIPLIIRDFLKVLP